MTHCRCAACGRDFITHKKFQGCCSVKCGLDLRYGQDPPERRIVDGAPVIAIHMPHGKVALIDECDAHLARYRWHAKKDWQTFYAERKPPRNGGDASPVRLHREILGITDPSIWVDHRNGDGLDCRRSNLRIASNAQNQQNKRKPLLNRSGFKGVKKYGRKWEARITENGRKHYLGAYPSPVDAALAYDEAARRLNGEFAAVNFPRPGERAA